MCTILAFDFPETRLLLFDTAHDYINDIVT